MCIVRSQCPKQAHGGEVPQELPYACPCFLLPKMRVKRYLSPQSAVKLMGALMA